MSTTVSISRICGRVGLSCYEGQR